MAHQVPWNSYILKRFSEVACLSDEEVWIMETRIKGMPISAQADFLGVSVGTLNNRISALKLKYDNAQKYDDTLPPRRSSAKETWLDGH